MHFLLFVGIFSFNRGTNMQGNYHAVHFDPKLFPEPTKFKPERFVKDNKLTNTENVMPFGFGKSLNF